jgi:uncharacterized protein YllA (UPF0747 family)
MEKRNFSDIMDRLANSLIEAAGTLLLDSKQDRQKQ